MKENCFDEGTIQAFLDGELSSDLLENVARHVALCDDCALLLNEAEEESAFAFDILGEEFNTLVPTERIRANVYQAISEIDKPKLTIWQKLISLRILSNPSIVAFASLLIVVGVVATVLSFRNQPSFPTNDDVVVIKPKSESVPNPVVPLIPNPATTTEGTPGKIEKVVYKPEPKVVVQNKTQVKNRETKIVRAKTDEVKTIAVEGEDTYIKTIATLETSVNAKKDNVLRASSRVSYERDMAVVEDSIKRMKDEVRKNPKNEAAKQILRNSYQNKIELLNSVTERSELMARLD